MARTKRQKNRIRQRKKGVRFITPKGRRRSVLQAAYNYDRGYSFQSYGGTRGF